MSNPTPTIALSGAFGVSASTATLATPSPTACAEECASFQVMALKGDQCVCILEAEVDIGAWRPTNASDCDNACGDWAASDFPALTAYFASQPGFCGGGAAWSAYEVFSSPGCFRGCRATGAAVFVDASWGRGLGWRGILPKRDASLAISAILGHFTCIPEVYDAVMTVGQGVVDKTRGLWFQVVLVQAFIDEIGTPDPNPEI